MPSKKDVTNYLRTFMHTSCIKINLNGSTRTATKTENFQTTAYIAVTETLSAKLTTQKTM